MRILDLKKVLLLLLILVTTANSQSYAQYSASKAEIKEQIVKHSLEQGLDPALALSVAQQESKFNKNARSSQGAVGVFQMLPSTAKAMNVDPYCLNGNIKGGVKYLKMMQDKFGSVELALAAYNAGPGAVKRHNGIPPYSQTKAYIRKIMANYYYLKVNPDPAMIKLASGHHFGNAKHKTTTIAAKPKPTQDVITIPSNTAIFLAKPAIADALVKMNRPRAIAQ